MVSSQILLSFVVCISFQFLQVCCADGSYRPIVIWHGMGDTCCFSFSMGAVKNELQKVLPGVYVYSVMIGNNIVEDEIEGFISNANDQVDFVCQQIKSDPNLKKMDLMQLVLVKEVNFFVLMLKDVMTLQYIIL